MISVVLAWWRWLTTSVAVEHGGLPHLAHWQPGSVDPGQKVVTVPGRWPTHWKGLFYWEICLDIDRKTFIFCQQSTWIPQDRTEFFFPLSSDPSSWYIQNPDWLVAILVDSEVTSEPWHYYPGIRWSRYLPTLDWRQPSKPLSASSCSTRWLVSKCSSVLCKQSKKRVF